MRNEIKEEIFLQPFFITHRSISRGRKNLTIPVLGWSR
jgi:hypothetical protein